MSQPITEAPRTEPGDKAPETPPEAPKVEDDKGKPSEPDKGFPENTPVAQMTETQKAAYYKHQNRKAEGRLEQFKGVTPEQIQQILEENENLKAAQMSASEKAVNDAAKQAAKEAREAADAEWRPKLQSQQLRAIAGSVLKGDQLNAWLSGMNPAAFASDTGEIDEEKVMGHLTAAFGVGGDRQQPPGQQRRDWGQYSGGSQIPSKPGEAGAAEAAKRFPKKST